MSPGVGVAIEITGGAELSRRLLQLDAAQNQPLQPLFQTISEEWVSGFKEHFRNQGDSAGRWVGLSPTTQKRRKKLGYGPAAPILLRTSDLLNSLQALTVTETEMSVGSRHESAALLQFGGTTGSTSAVPDRDVPARPFVSLSEETISDTFEMIEAYFFPEPEDGAGGQALA